MNSVLLATGHSTLLAVFYAQHCPGIAGVRETECSRRLLYRASAPTSVSRDAWEGPHLIRVHCKHIVLSSHKMTRTLPYVTAASAAPSQSNAACSGAANAASSEAPEDSSMCVVLWANLLRLSGSSAHSSGGMECQISLTSMLSAGYVLARFDDVASTTTLMDELTRHPKAQWNLQRVQH